MKSTPFLCTCLAAMASLAAHAQTPSLKPGLWEVTSKIGGNAKLDAAMAQMQQQMASMPPEQRKMVEDMMAKQGVKVGAAGAGAGAMAAQTCITPDMAARYEMPVQQRGNCTSTTSDRTASGMKIAFSCTNPVSSGEGQVSFSGPGAYSMQMSIHTTVAGKPETMTVDGNGKWLSADCGSVKPRAATQK